MKTDTAYLRRHYASLSDEALLDVDETDLTEDAKQIYDEELAERGLTRRLADEEDEGSAEGRVRQGDGKPDWLGAAAVAARFSPSPGMNVTDGALEARDALEAAGIPCYLSTLWVDPPPVAEPRQEVRLMVPGNLSFEAESVLDKDIFNQEAEAMWKTHLQTLSDDELREVDIEVLLAGLKDRIARVTRAYNEELKERQ